MLFLNMSILLYFQWLYYTYGNNYMHYTLKNTHNRMIASLIINVIDITMKSIEHLQS